MQDINVGDADRDRIRSLIEKLFGDRMLGDRRAEPKSAFGLDPTIRAVAAFAEPMDALQRQILAEGQLTARDLAEFRAAMMSAVYQMKRLEEMKREAEAVTIREITPLILWASVPHELMYSPQAYEAILDGFRICLNTQAHVQGRETATDVILMTIPSNLDKKAILDKVADEIAWSQARSVKQGRPVPDNPQG